MLDVRNVAFGHASARTSLDDLRANFAAIGAQGAVAYADEMAANHPELEHRALLADAVTAIGEFHDLVTRWPETAQRSVHASPRV